MSDDNSMEYDFPYFLDEDIKAEVRQLAQDCPQSQHTPSQCAQSHCKVSMGGLTFQMKKSRF